MHFIAIGIEFLIVPLLGPGIVRRIRARAQRRAGPPLLQPWYDCARFLPRRPIDGDFAGLFARISPPFALLSSGLLWLTVCSGTLPLLLVPFFLTAELFWIAGFAAETGTSFAGMAVGRQLLLALLTKPILFIVLLMLDSRPPVPSDGLTALIGALILGCLGLACLAEMAKPPFDDPRTHLELTMVHEAALLEASGRSLALFEIADMLKQSALVALWAKTAVCFFAQDLPFAESLHSGPASALVALVLFAGVGYWESVSVRRKWSYIPEVLGLAMLFLVLLLTLMQAKQGMSP
jgi:formate hydrogenlyase subunit 4